MNKIRHWYHLIYKYVISFTQYKQTIPAVSKSRIFHDDGCKLSSSDYTCSCGLTQENLVLGRFKIYKEDLSSNRVPLNDLTFLLEQLKEKCSKVDMSKFDTEDDEIKN